MAALNNPNSPQARAYQWMQQDPNVATYTPGRMQQRMALAIFFYATNFEDLTVVVSEQPPEERQEEVPNEVVSDVFNNLFGGDGDGTTNVRPLPMTVVWDDATDWLSYDVHECDWFSRAESVCDSKDNYKYLTLDDNGLLGQLPLELGWLTTLEQVQLSDNLQLYGSLPTTLALLTELRSLQMANLPQLAGTIPRNIAKLHATLQTIDLRETPFFQKIVPTDLGRLTQLRRLLLSTRANTASGSTSRTGTLPTEMGNMVSLYGFSISGAEVTGTLPTQLGLLTELELLSISNTEVAGPIPSQFGQLPNLVTLELANNQLSSSLPEELADLGGTLSLLYVNDNELTGTIPFQYSELSRCKTMAFQNNQLTGTVPLGMCYLKESSYISILQVDCGEVECECGCDCY